MTDSEHRQALTRPPGCRPRPPTPFEQMTTVRISALTSKNESPSRIRMGLATPQPYAYIQLLRVTLRRVILADSGTPILSCKGCGKTKTGVTGDPTDISPSEHCGDCPPWRCYDCGEMDSAAQHCPCWIDLATMAPADVKALFAEDGTFNVGANRVLSMGRD